ncbi:hypothetical protein D9M68_743540 [compost metagenome]
MALAQRLAAEEHQRGGRARGDDGVRVVAEHQQLAGLVDLARVFDLAFGHVHRLLPVAAGQGLAGAGLPLGVQVEQRRMRAHRAGLAVGAAGHQAHPHALRFHHRQGVCGVVGEGGLGFFVGLGQRHPELHQLQPAAGVGIGVGEALAVRDAASGRHPVHLAGSDDLQRAQAVAVRDLAAEQIAHRGQADVRVRPHVGGAVVLRRQRHRAGVVQEHEGADVAALRKGQHAPHRQAVAKVGGACIDHHFQHRVLLSVVAQSLPILPLWKSANAWWISASLFITNGP